MTSITAVWNKAKRRTGLGDMYLALFFATLVISVIWAVVSACLGGVTYLYGIGTAIAMLGYLGLRIYFVKILELEHTEEKEESLSIWIAGAVVASGIFCILGELEWDIFEVVVCSFITGFSVWFLLLQTNPETLLRMFNWLNEAFLRKLGEVNADRWNRHIKEAILKFGSFRKVCLYSIAILCIMSHLIRGRFGVLPCQLWLLGSLIDFFLIGIFSGLSFRTEKETEEWVLEKSLRIRGVVYGVYLVGASVCYLMGSFMHGLFRYSDQELVFTTGLVMFLILNMFWIAFTMRVKGSDVLGGLEQHGVGVLLAVVGIAFWWFLSYIQVSVFGMVRLNWQECLVAWVFSVFFLPIGMIANTITMRVIKK